jgi:hypothetical protein
MHGESKRARLILYKIRLVNIIGATQSVLKLKPLHMQLPRLLCMIDSLPLS